jgi:hypothetical protein
MPKEPEKSGGQTPLATLARGPDGALWLLRKEEAPEKVDGDRKTKAENIIEQTEEQLSKLLTPSLMMGVHVGDDVFDGHTGQHCGPEDISD